MNKELFEKTEKVKIQEEDDEIKRLRSEMPLNFKIRLLEGFVRINEWDYVDDIIGRIYDYRLDLTLSGSLL